MTLTYKCNKFFNIDNQLNTQNLKSVMLSLNNCYRIVCKSILILGFNNSKFDQTKMFFIKT